ncbi:ornithine carbamoyltransferase [Ferrimonas aestuarii]|uniref:Ornithine carbamoyltransferase n=1 Tax=Ferrimonas aestuarii TaxID=2569539 RepID=A0A4U1BEP5_9GAMM|nr:ornithine carbamoyltransferase [Ferrimonas aestuarii]TKB49125.1 ornithine carbamoyltransferase [Ferrimonas aestuarii]
MANLLTLKDWSSTDIQQVLQLAAQMKADYSAFDQTLKGKSIATLFEKPSLRTRVSFDVGINKLGGHSVYLDQQNGALGKREEVKDFAQNLSRWCDAIVARVFDHNTLIELAKHATVPVVNSLCDLYHPCQALADMLTLQEQFGELKGKTLAYVGDGNNVTHSLMFASAKLGMNMVVVCPEGHFPDGKMVLEAKAIAEQQGATLTLSSELAALEGAHAIYTDTWISMGDGTSLDEIKAKFAPYQVNSAMMQNSGAQFFLHCQPAYRGVEVSAEVMDASNSLAMEQAENRMHAQNAVLKILVK